MVENIQHPFKQFLLDAFEKIKQNKFKGSGHLPVETYEIFVDSLTNGKSSLKQIFASKEKYDELKRAVVDLPEDPKFEALFRVYRIAQNNRAAVREQLKTLSGQNTPNVKKERKRIVARYYAQQEAFAALTANLPAEYLLNEVFLIELGSGIFSHDIKSEKDLRKTFTENVRAASQKSGISISEQNTAAAVNKAVNIIRPSGPSPLSTSLAMLIAIVGRSTQEEPEESQEEKEATEEEQTPGVFSAGSLLGTGAFAVLKAREKDLDEFELEEENKRKKVEDKEKSKQQQEPQAIKPKQFPVPTSPTANEAPRPIQQTTISPGLKSVVSSLAHTFAILLKKGLDLAITALSGGTSKILQIALKVAGKLLSFLGGVFAASGQTDTADTLKKINLAVILLVLLPIFIIFGLSFFDVGVLRPTAMVSSPLTPSTSTPTSILFTLTPTTQPAVSPTPAIIFPTSGSSTPLVPVGWPTQTGCVYVGPNGSITHRGTTAQSIDVVAPNAYGRYLGKLSRGLPVYATLDGIVSWVEGGYEANQHDIDLGNRVEICHVNDFNTQYPYRSRRPFNCIQRVARFGHLLTTNPNLRVGSIVKKGDFLGTIDETGYSSIGDHVHYELRGFGPILNTLPISQELKNGLDGCFGWSQCPKVCW